MKTVIIKYNAGNIQSVLFALKRIGYEAIISDNADEINSADKIIFPGVGEASSAMNHLKEKKLDELIIQLKQPVLGICLGMQLMCLSSEEGNTKCMGIFDEQVVRFQSNEQYKVPHVGWNTINHLKSPLFQDVKENEYMYFVHGYYAPQSDSAIASTNYGLTYSSALSKNNFYGVQFHPEKSGSAGEKILKNFLSI
jgi:glutamine amidotransferase